MHRYSYLTFALLLACAPSVSAQPADQAEVVEQIRLLRERQAQIAELQRQTDADIQRLEGWLAGQLPADEPADAPPAPAETAPSAPSPGPESRWSLSGDLRLRTQHDDPGPEGPARHSSQLRARAGAAYQASDALSVAARLITGNPDDPRSADVQLSNWNDDLEVSLDLAYAKLELGDVELTGGKLPQPFTRTDLVWDSDVNPQGVAARYRRPTANGGALRAGGLYFLVDEWAGGSDSHMAGAQLGYDWPELGDFTFGLSGSYYHYSLGSLAGAGESDWRTNRLDDDGRYLSKFRLANVIGGVTWRGWSERWPVRLTADYVRNLGAVDNADTGFGLDLAAGRTGTAGDWRFTYGYSQTEVDAVLAAFSHDNIAIATNYKLHALTVDYAPTDNTLLTALWYHYRPNDSIHAGRYEPGEWIDRMRLLFLINF